MFTAQYNNTLFRSGKGYRQSILIEKEFARILC